MVEAILHLSLQQAECARGPSFKTLLSTLTGSLAKLPPALPLNLKIPSLRPGRPGTGPLRCVYGGFIEDGMFQLLPFHYSDVRSGCGLHSRLVAKPERMFCRAANLKSSPPPLRSTIPFPFSWPQQARARFQPSGCPTRQARRLLNASAASPADAIPKLNQNLFKEVLRQVRAEGESF